MAKQKFLNIDINGEGNIGVIALGEVSQPTESEKCDYIHCTIQPKLQQALQEHFDTDVEITSINVISTLAPIEVRVAVSLELNGEMNVEEITLNETWVY